MKKDQPRTTDLFLIDLKFLLGARSPLREYVETKRSEWRAILDNLRNFFLSPTAEMLSFLQQLRATLG
jgi:hypothetical protein